MPIQRFGSMLVSKGQFDAYMRLLKENYAAGNLEGVMCRSLVSVDWQRSPVRLRFQSELGLAVAGDRGRASA